MRAKTFDVLIDSPLAYIKRPNDIIKQTAQWRRVFLAGLICQEKHSKKIYVLNLLNCDCNYCGK